MSFNVDWNLLETESMSEWTKELLSETLNSGKRPNILASNIEIKDLNFGKIPPTFELLEIGELEKDRFRGIFKIKYDGDAHITLHTKVQANPLKIYSDNLVELEHFVNGSEAADNFISPEFLLSNSEFSLPLDLKLSDIKISGIGIIVFSKTKGLTLVFRNDPLDSIKVSSTFDMVQVLANFLQKQIESQIRELFRETLPTVLHKLSLKYITSNTDDFFNSLNLNDFASLAHAEDLNLFDIDHYSARNLQRNLKLFNSRETLNLHIPKLKNVIQRSNLQKFNKKLSPNLLTSLNLLDVKDQARLIDSNGTNGIPINVLTDKDYNEVQTILKNISDIQSNIYYQKNNNNYTKPKRRTIKLNKSKKSQVAEQMSPASSVATATSISNIDGVMSKSVSMSSSVSGSPTINEYKSQNSSMSSTIEDEDTTVLNSMSPDNSDTQTLIDEEEIMVRPRPMRANGGKPIHSHSHFHRDFHNTSPNNSNSSLLSGVGIGNNYFNFTNKEYVNTNEFNEKHNEKINEAKINEKKDESPINYMDLNSIKQRLHELKKLDMQNHKHFYMDLPPPYQI